jgi:hypothetical protein
MTVVAGFASRIVLKRTPSADHQRLFRDVLARSADDGPRLYWRVDPATGSLWYDTTEDRHLTNHIPLDVIDEVVVGSNNSLIIFV